MQAVLLFIFFVACVALRAYGGVLAEKTIAEMPAEARRRLRLGMAHD